MKKLLAVFICILIVTSAIAVPSYASDMTDQVGIRLNNGVYTFDVPPIIRDSRVLVPFRGLFEAFGADVQWNESERSIIATHSGIEMKLYIDNPVAVVDGKTVTMDVAPTIIEGRTLVPLRFVGESLGYTVMWDDTTRMVDVFSVTPDTYKQLQRLRDAYGVEFIEWLAGMYDIETGGFYYSVSARDNEGFSADIESTSMALNIMETSGLKAPGVSFREYLGEEFTERITNYIQSRQDEKTGYFFDPQFGRDLTNTTRLGRNLNQGKVMHERFEIEPLYPYPLPTEGQAADSSVQPTHLQSLANFEQWMRALPWDDNPYAAANQLSSSQIQAEALGYGTAVCNFLKEIQNPETGLWGKNLDYEALNASLKACVYFNPNSEPYPNVEKMVESLVNILTTSKTPPQTASETWNPITLLNFARESFGGEFTPSVKKIMDEYVDDVIKWAVDELDVFRKSDGGFSYSRRMSTAYSQGVTVSLGLAEGDMNAGMLLLNLWEKCHSISGMPKPRLYNDEESEHFIELIKNAKPPQKTSERNPLVYTQDFNDLNQDTILETGYSIRCPQNNAFIVQDPDNLKIKNNVFMLVAEPDAEAKNMIVMSMVADKPNVKKITFEADIMLSEVSNGILYNNTMHNTRSGTAVQWMVIGENDMFALHIRGGASGYGERAGGLLETDVWYNMRIEYQPKGMTDSVVEVYIDDELALVTNQYSGFGTREPTNSLDCSILNSEMGTKSLFYLDNVNLYVE